MFHINNNNKIIIVNIIIVSVTGVVTITAHAHFIVNCTGGK